MKTTAKLRTLLTALIFITTSSVFAKNIAKYDFSTRGEDESQINSYSVTLDDQQEMRITVSTTKSNTPYYFPTAGSVTHTTNETKILNKQVYDLLKNKVITLSNAKIYNTRMSNRIICMMMPSPLQSNDNLSIARVYDRSSGDFLGDMKFILGPQGCWVRNPVHPIESYQIEQARELKLLIKVLALDAITEQP